MTTFCMPSNATF